MLFVVSTPIGNLEDIGMRALRVLREVPIIICERPNHTRKLLSYFRIYNKKIIQYTEANKNRQIPYIIKLLQKQDAAFVSDAGTIGISDPGPELIRASREQGIKIACVPGPSALTAAIALSGERINQFLFTGFMPRKQNEIKRLLELSTDKKKCLIAFEVPHRIKKTLNFISKNYPQIQIVIVGEISKINEKVLKGTALELLESLTKNKDLSKGEWVILINC